MKLVHDPIWNRTEQGSNDCINRMVSDDIWMLVLDNVCRPAWRVVGPARNNLSWDEFDRWGL
jgi:hypothetical protein